MQKITTVILCYFVAVLLITGCKKNQSDEDYTSIDEPVIPVFTEKVTTTVSGFIINEAGKPLAGAAVKAGTSMATTDEFGYFKISNASLTKNIGLVKVTMAGHFTGFKTIMAKANGQHFFRMMLLNKVETGTVPAATGGSVSTADAATISLPAAAVVNAVTGAAYTGTVHISARVLPVAASSNLLFALPGDGRGINTEGHLKSLNAHASIAVDLNGDAGEKLQLAANKKASVTMPIAASLAGQSPAVIALWSFDEEKALWKEEGLLTKTGNNYTGQVSHFSYWSGASHLSLVNFTAQVLTTTLQPLVHVPVLINFAGQPFNTGYGKFAFTDANGFVTGAIPANSNFVLNVMSTCSNEAYNHNFSSTHTDVDLGTITGNLGQAVVSLSGNVINCNGQPLMNGYVQTYDHGFYNRIPVVNGSFNFTGISCNNLPVNYIAVDNDTHQQSNPQSINLQAGSNNLGTLSACGISSLGWVNYTLNGVTRTLEEPAAKLLGFYHVPSGYSTIVSIPDTSGGSDFSFQFDGGMALGSTHNVSDIWSIGYPSGRGYAPVPLNITITEFGDIGGFISGHFSGQVLDFADRNIIFNVNYTFRIKRAN